MRLRMAVAVVENDIGMAGARGITHSLQAGFCESFDRLHLSANRIPPEDREQIASFSFVVL